MQFISEADPAVVSALMNTAEAHARRIIAGTARPEGADGGGGGRGPQRGPNAFAPAGILADILKAMPIPPNRGPREEDDDNL